jgi:DNA-binding protein HU-beta
VFALWLRKLGDGLPRVPEDGPGNPPFGRCSQSARHAEPKKQAHAIAADLVDAVTSILKNGDRVRMSGLGIIEVKDRPARMGRNPATGATVQIAASKKVAFRAAKELKAAV